MSLSSATSTSEKTETTLPSWYSTAQSGIVDLAKSGYSGALNDTNLTVGNQLFDTFGKSGNPFDTATSNLSTIQTNLMNPFLPQAQGGGFNMNSPLGALYAAQNAKLDQILPQVTAKEGAVGLGGGNFGSLRGQTATGTARAGALTTLAEQQNKAALDAYGQATQAAQAQGNVASQQATSLLPVAKYEQTRGLDALQKYADVIGSASKALDTTTTTTKAGSKLENIQKLGAFALQSGLALDKVMGGTTGIGWVDNLAKKLSDPTNVSYTTEIANTAGVNDPGYGWKYYSDGTTIDPSGNYYYQGDLIYSNPDATDW
jgi:hypothetical protein